jgi:hypothetical protein
MGAFIPARTGGKPPERVLGEANPAIKKEAGSRTLSFEHDPENRLPLFRVTL